MLIRNRNSLGFVRALQQWCIILLLNSSLLGACQSPAALTLSQNAPISRAETLRRYFERSNMLYRFPRDQGYTTLIRAFPRFSPKTCGLADAADQPSTVIPGIANIFMVDFPSDRRKACSGSPDFDVCTAISDNCATIDRSIFCDANFLRRLEIEANASYFTAHSGIIFGGQVSGKPGIVPLQVLPNWYYEILSKFHQEGLTADHPRLLNPPRELEFSGKYAKHFPSLSNSLMIDVIITFWLAHEYAHIEQHACPNDALASLTPELRRLLRSYLSAICAPSAEHATIQNEFAADLRGIDLALQFVETLLSVNTERTYGIALPEQEIPRLHFSAEEEFRATKTLGAIPHILMTKALDDSVEYETIFDGDFDSARETLGREPSNDERELERYYINYGIERSKQDIAANHHLTSHLPLALRAVIISGKIMERAASESEAQQIDLSRMSRLASIASGEMIGANMRFCHTSLQEAASAAINFMIETVQLKEESRSAPSRK